MIVTATRSIVALLAAKRVRGWVQNRGIFYLSWYLIASGVSCGLQALLVLSLLLGPAQAIRDQLGNAFIVLLFAVAIPEVRLGLYLLGIGNGDMSHNEDEGDKNAT